MGNAKAAAGTGSGMNVDRVFTVDVTRYSCGHIRTVGVTRLKVNQDCIADETR